MITPETAKRVKLLGLDVDGVLTDNAIYLGNVAGERVELKRFDISDGLGIRILQKAGIPVVWISGRASPATSLRAAELQVTEVIQVDSAAKLPEMTGLLARRGLRWEDIAYVGDDIADLPVMRRVGLPVAVANAVKEVKESAVYVTSATGGSGAVREVIEAILKARGAWEESLNGYLKDRGDDAA